MTDEELIAELRKPWFTNGCERYQLDAADRIEALVKERDEAKRLMGMRHQEMLAADGLMRKHQRRAERLEAALKWQAEQPEAHPFMVARARAALAELTGGKHE